MSPGSARRTLATSDWSALVAPSGGSSPQTASMSWDVSTTRPGSSARRIRSVRSRTPARGAASRPSRTSSGPSTRISTLPATGPLWRRSRTASPRPNSFEPGRGLGRSTWEGPTGRDVAAPSPYPLRPKEVIHAQTSVLSRAGDLSAGTRRDRPRRGGGGERLPRDEARLRPAGGGRAHGPEPGQRVGARGGPVHALVGRRQRD